MPDASTSIPPRLAVSPATVADLGRQIATTQTALDAGRLRLAGPQAPPPVGDARCGVAYQAAAQQLGGLVTTAAEREHALARSLTAAALCYAALDASAVGGQP